MITGTIALAPANVYRGRAPTTTPSAKVTSNMGDPSADQIRRSRELLLNQYAHLNGEGKLDAAPIIERDALLAGIDKRRGFTDREIEDIARRLRRMMWDRQDTLWPGRKPDPLEALDPELALDALGFSVDHVMTLGEDEDEIGRYDVAGVLDRDNAHVSISDKPLWDSRLFTLAHELGHAILHEGTVFHRDRPVDGSGVGRRDRIEVEANRFAAFFLMPRAAVTKEFAARFGTQSFVLNDTRAQILARGDLAKLRKRCRTRRGLSRLLAQTDWYDGVPCDPLMSMFRVTIEAMAIRLEQLGLVPEHCIP